MYFWHTVFDIHKVGQVKSSCDTLNSMEAWVTGRSLHQDDFRSWVYQSLSAENSCFLWLGRSLVGGGKVKLLAITCWIVPADSALLTWETCNWNRKLSFDTFLQLQIHLSSPHGAHSLNILRFSFSHVAEWAESVKWFQISSVGHEWVSKMCKIRDT